MKSIPRSFLSLLAFLFVGTVTAQQPVITSLSPSSGNPGASVLITGTGFNATAANNIVYFGATQAIVTASSTTTMNVTVPVGATYMPVSVNNTASTLVGYAQHPFLPTYDNSAFAAGIVNFINRVDFTAGSNPYAVQIADIDGDGKADVVVANEMSSTISIYRNTSTMGSITAGSFAPKVDFATDVWPASIVIGDIDGDGKPDIVTANRTANTISVFRNTSTAGAITTGSLAARVDFVTGTDPQGIAMGDIDGDGKADITVTNSFSSSVSVFHNTSTVGAITSGSFAAKVDFASASARGIVIGDIDGDGKPEMVVANVSANSISVYHNTSTIGAITAGSFAANVNFTTGTNPYNLAYGDIDGDGKADISVVNNGASTISVLRNTSTVGAISSGSFATKVDFVTASSPISVAIGDIDGDGKADLAIANESSNGVSVLRNTATSGSIASGSFALKVDFATDNLPFGIAIGDIDGDNKPDIATANASGSLSVLANSPLLPITGTDSLCVAGTTTLSCATAGGTWSSGATGIATVGGVSGIVTGVAAGTAIISYTIAGGTITKQVTVNQLPDPGTLSGSMPVCAGNDITLSASVAGGTWSSGATGIATVGTGGIVTAVAGGTATISYTVTNMCGSVAATVDVTVNTIPGVGSTTGSSGVCVGSNVTLTNSVTGGDWSSSDIAIATVGTTGVVTGVVAGTATITYTLTNGCGTADVTTDMTVNPLPDVITGALTICNTLTTTLSSASIGGTWSSVSTRVSVGTATGIITGVATGTAVVTYTLPTGCITTTTVTVNQQPSAISGILNVCLGATRTLINGLGGGTWSSSNAAVASIGTASVGVILGVSADTTRITYTLANGCATSSGFTVNPVPAAITGTFGLCAGTTTTLANASPGGTWSSSNTAKAVVSIGTGYVQAYNAGTTIITYKTTGNCISTAIVTVSASPATITGTLTLCDGATTQLHNTVPLGIWISSNTSVAVLVTPTGLVGGVGAGTVLISYALSNGCYRSVVVTVNPIPDTVLGSDHVCTARSVNLTSATTGGTWSSSNTARATVGTSGIVTGVSSGTVLITYRMPTTCRRVVEMTVNTTPAAVTGTLSVCEGLTTAITSATPGGTWQSSATSIATVASVAGIVTGVATGTTTMSYVIIATGCSATAIFSVNPTPSAIVGAANVCAGASTTLTCAATGGTWSSSAPGVVVVGSATGVVTGVSAGLATITYSLSTSCIITHVVSVSPLPVAGAVTGLGTVCETGTTTLTASVGGGTWSSLSGHVSVSVTGVVTGLSGGVDTVLYSITDGCGIAVVPYPITVNPLPDTAVIGGSAHVCVGRTSALFSSIGGGIWSNGATSAATVSGSGVVTGNVPGTAIISYTRTNACGSSAATVIVTVNSLVDPGTIIGKDTTCMNDTVHLVGTVSGGVWVSSASWIATVNAGGVVMGVFPGTAIIKYIVSNECSVDTAYRTLTVKLPGECATAIHSPVEAHTTSLSMHPNPTNGILTVDAPVAGVLTIYTIDGREVQAYTINKQTETITLPHSIAAGIYMCRFEGKDGSVVMGRLVYEP